jgi:hypothetical protein
MASKKSATKSTALARRDEDKVTRPARQASQGLRKSNEASEEDLVESRATPEYSSDADFSADDLFIPRVNCLQGMSKAVKADEAKAGQILVTPGFDPVDELVIIPMVMARLRKYREDGEFGNPVICSSGNGKLGVGNPGGDCLRCKFAQWRDGKGGKRIPPPCVYIYSYGCWIPEYGVQAVMDLYKTGEMAAKSLNGLIGQAGGFGKQAFVATTTQIGVNKTWMFRFAKIKSKDVKAAAKDLEVARQKFTLGATPVEDSFEE